MPIEKIYYTYKQKWATKLLQKFAFVGSLCGIMTEESNIQRLSKKKLDIPLKFQKTVWKQPY